LVYQSFTANLGLLVGISRRPASDYIGSVALFAGIGALRNLRATQLMNSTKTRSITRIRSNDDDSRHTIWEIFRSPIPATTDGTADIGVASLGAPRRRISSEDEESLASVTSFFSIISRGNKRRVLETVSQLSEELALQMRGTSHSRHPS
jgi:hypothetical protein